MEVVEHRMSAAELKCPSCGDEMVEIGKEVRRSLVMIPAQIKIRGGLVLYLRLQALQGRKHRDASGKGGEGRSRYFRQLCLRRGPLPTS